MARPRKYTIGSSNDTGWTIREISPKVKQNTHMLWVSHADAPNIWYEITVFMFNSGVKRPNVTLADQWADRLVIEHPNLHTQMIENCYVPLVMLELPDTYFAKPGMRVLVGKHGSRDLYLQGFCQDMYDYRLRGTRLMITDLDPVQYVNFDHGPAGKAALRDQELLRRVGEARRYISRQEQTYLKALMEYRNARASIVRDLMELHGVLYEEPYWLPAAPPGENIEMPKLPPIELPDGPVNFAEREEAAAWAAERKSPTHQDKVRAAHDETAENLLHALQNPGNKAAPHPNRQVTPPADRAVHPSQPVTDPAEIASQRAQAYWAATHGDKPFPGMPSAADTQTLPLPLDGEKELVKEPLKASDQTEPPETYTEPFVIPEPSIKKAAVPDSTFDDDEFAGFPPPSGFVRPKNTTGIHQNFGSVPQWEMAPHLYANFNGKARQWVEMTDEEILSIGGLTKLQGRTQRREHLIRKD